MHVVTVVGARPQFVKAAALQRAFREAGIRETIVHTGQHYSTNMSGAFFDELNIPQPNANLLVGSGTHAYQTATMMVRLEKFLLETAGVDCVVVMGDTNSTLAGALVAAKLNMPLAHVEAGLRSNNRSMPEEINRVVTDRLSDLLFCPSGAAMRALDSEGMVSGAYEVGDVMLDVLLTYRETAEQMYPVHHLQETHAAPFFLATVHRQENTDDAGRLREILGILEHLDRPVVWPIHPRASGAIKRAGLALPGNVTSLDPVGYLNMVSLIRASTGVLTDSGGLQKEAYWLGTPCITLRDETEWEETKVGGWNQVTGVKLETVLQAIDRMPSGDRPALYGTGNAAEQIAVILKTACVRS